MLRLCYTKNLNDSTKSLKRPGGTAHKKNGLDAWDSHFEYQVVEYYTCLFCCMVGTFGTLQPSELQWILLPMSCVLRSETTIGRAAFNLAKNAAGAHPTLLQEVKSWYAIVSKGSNVFSSPKAFPSSFCRTAATLKKGLGLKTPVLGASVEA